ncbi:MAG TPA: AAA family ATPase [Bryobacteraceae bacterium]
MFENFYGNASAAEALFAMTRLERIPQTILLSGPEGTGKATLARRFAAGLLGSAEKIEQDDLSLSANAEAVAEREKWPADKRNEDPLLFASHPDFVTFPPDGPLRQIGIDQMRLLKERAQFKPLRGTRRVFLIDHIDRANEQAANSLLKTLEEPPEHLILMLTAENSYDLLPTIRSRAVTFHLGRVGMDEMRAFVSERGLKDPERRIALAAGSPGVAISLDLESYDQRRDAMLTLLRVAAGRAPFAEWVKHAEAIAPRKQEKLELFLAVLYVLLEDILELAHGIGEIRNIDIRRELEALARAVPFSWIRAAVRKTDELSELVRRNIQKSIALDSLAVELRGAINA